MIYKKLMFTPGVVWPDGEFTPKASPQDVEEAVEREGYGAKAFALMGFDPEGDVWEVLMVGTSSRSIVRKTRMMFGIDLEWGGHGPMEFDRADGVGAYEYITHDGEKIRAWEGLIHLRIHRLRWERLGGAQNGNRPNRSLRHTA